MSCGTFCAPNSPSLAALAGTGNSAEDQSGAKGKGCDFGYALADNSRERVPSVDACPMVKKLIFASNKSMVCMPAIAHTGVRNAGCEPGGQMANGCGGPLSLFMLQRSRILNFAARADHTLFIAGGCGISGGHSEPQLRS